ncbi:hypothetical protein [Salinactinospora qingdaonensis]|uniref:Small secreted domain n=1 Tax=Salinactinospora qingdaonensis TaxID=702744 RepID=A0ABP7G620_9ACTN
MKRIATLSGLIATSALALGALAGPAQADNNADVQNVTIPICADVLQLTGVSSDGCNVVENHLEEGKGSF